MSDKEIKAPEEVKLPEIKTPWLVIITNFMGVVHESEDEKSARKAFAIWAKKSSMGYGQCGHEQVSLMKDGVLVDRYQWVRGVPLPTHFNVAEEEHLTEET